MTNISCPYMHILNGYIASHVKALQVKQDARIFYNLQAMALDAYVYGYPIVLMNVTEKSMIDTGLEINQFFSQGTFLNPKFNVVVRPNVDTLYSQAWLDLSREPIILHVPDTFRKYYILQMLDDWTNVFASIGARTTGTKEGDFAIVGPGWKGVLPQGIPKIYAPSNTGWIINRIQTNGPRDYPLVDDIQDKYTLTLLSHYKKSNISIKNTMEKGEIYTNKVSPMDKVKNMSAENFFSIMMNAMYMNPPYPAIQTLEMNKNLLMLGLLPTKNFDIYSLNPLVQQALQYAVQNGPKVIAIESIKTYKNNEVNGWEILLKNIGYYGIDYTSRAVIAMSVLGANIPQDAVYGHNVFDKDGNPLNGTNKYIIHFNKDQIPPVNAFWSITLYNSQGFLIENPINRYAVSSHFGKLNYNADGSLDIFIQNTSPSIVEESNWLPAPTGPFNLTLRMYWPKQKVLNCEYKPPAVMRLGIIVGVGTFSGVVRNVETIENNIFLVINKDTVFYASTDSDVAKKVLKLHVGNYVDIKYVLGTPKKYKGRMAMPLSNIQVIK